MASPLTPAARCAPHALRRWHQSGTVLFDRPSDLDKLWAHVREPPPKLLSLRPDLPVPLGKAVDRALAKDRQDRQQSAGEFAREAGAALPHNPLKGSS